MTAASVLTWGPAVEPDPPVIKLLQQAVRGWPEHAVGARCPYIPLSMALTSEWPSDAHIAAYRARRLERRLRGSALQSEHIEHLGGAVYLQLLIFDIDGPGHVATEEWWQAEQVKVAALLDAHPGIVAFRTRGGYRLLGRLERAAVLRSHPDALAWRRWYSAWVAHLARAYGIVADPKCCDWQRLYRLPHATREGGAGPERRAVLGDRCRVGAWVSVGAVEAEAAAAAAAAEAARKPAPDLSRRVTGSGWVLRSLFEGRGWCGPTESSGVLLVVCPWRDEHSRGGDLDGSTVIMPPTHGSNLGLFICQHAHSRGGGRAADTAAVLRLFSEDEVDRANGRPTRAQRAAQRAAARANLEPPWPTEQWPGGGR